MIIQFIGSAFIIIIILQLSLKFFKDKAGLVKSLFWLVFWFSVLVFIWLPKDIIDQFGSLIGVGRGIDALVYLSIIALFYLILKLNSRIDKLEMNITKLVRELAKVNVKK